MRLRIRSMLSSSELVALFWAIAGNTVALLSGIVGIALTVWCVFAPQSPARNALLVAALVALWLSPVLAWRDQYRQWLEADTKVRELSEHRPNLSGQVEQLMSHTLQPSGQFQLVVWMLIKNTGELPSMASQFQLEYTRPDGSVIRDSRNYIVLKEQPYTLSGDGQKYTITNDQMLLELVSHAIPSGEGRIGVIIFRPDISQVDFRKSERTAKISFRDIRDQLHEIPLISEPGKEIQEPLYFPGLGTIVSPKKKEK